MEKAIFITKADELTYVTAKYHRLYFGNEFCQQLIPSPSELKKVLTYVQKENLSFSLVTPYVTNEGLKKLEGLFDLFRNARLADEIIVNDWGVLNLVNRRYPQMKPVLGRLLTKQKRGPTLIKLLKREGKKKLFEDPKNPEESYVIVQKKLPLELDSYYKGSNAASVPVLHRFLISRGIERIELDNTAQGLALDLPLGNISASVYFPYIYITTTFYCPSAGCGGKDKSFLKVKPCHRECQKYIFQLRHKSMPKVIYLKGNTQFYKNRKLHIQAWAKAGVDRIVFEPHIPV